MKISELIKRLQGAQKELGDRHISLLLYNTPSIIIPHNLIIREETVNHYVKDAPVIEASEGTIILDFKC